MGVLQRSHNSEGLDHAVSVADINGDGHLYVFSLGQGCVRGWSNTGDVILDLSLPDLFKSKEWNAHRSLPLVADIDGDSKPDIVFSDQNVIYAIHADGTNVAGYPMTVPSVINHGISIADIDNDGKNEIIAADAESKSMLGKLLATVWPGAAPASTPATRAST